MFRAHVPGKVQLLWLLVIGIGLSASLAIPAQQPGLPQPPAGSTSGQANPLDEPINWLMEARNNYTKGVRNYTCTLIKRERVRGVLQDQNIILFTSKVEPFSVYMKWLAPHKFAGQEVAYVKDRNRDMMRVKAKGIVGLGAGFVNIDPQDRRVMEHSRHTIREAGLGHMIEENLKNMQIARGINKTTVQTAEYTFDKRPCLRIETINREQNQQLYCYRSVLYLEKESKLPMRLENYLWPSPGAQAGELLEEFSYADLRFNIDLRDDLFNK
jgi:Protein of unknown function (DUF1571)